MKYKGLRKVEKALSIFTKIINQLKKSIKAVDRDINLIEAAMATRKSTIFTLERKNNDDISRKEELKETIKKVENKEFKCYN